MCLERRRFNSHSQHQKLAESVSAAAQVNENIKIKNNIKEKYYAKKLELYEREIQAREKRNDIKEKEISVLEKLSENISKISLDLEIFLN